MLPRMGRKREPLVCEHIEKLSSDMLEHYPDIIREIVARRHGVYALYKKGRLYYVGLAINLRNRLRAHMRDRHKGLWDTFNVYLTINHRHLKELESLVIRIAKPKGNAQGGKFARSRNLMPKVRKQWRQETQRMLRRLTGRDSDDTDDIESLDHSSPDLAGLVARPFWIRATYKKKAYKARVRRNGTIRLKSRIFDSPSDAARAVVGYAANGWSFWRYERAPGQWIRLREIRRSGGRR